MSSCYLEPPLQNLGVGFTPPGKSPFFLIQRVFDPISFTLRPIFLKFLVDFSDAFFAHDVSGKVHKVRVVIFFVIQG